jgi:outer membrane receptor protein involved in Fe transport
MGKWIFFIAAMAAGFGLYGQGQGTFKGIIRDKQTDEPLVGASVILKLDRSFGTAADENGQFSIKLNHGSYIFEISFTGMKSDSVSFHIEAGQVIERTILLEPFVSQLQGVEIKAGKFERPIEEMTVSMEIIKADLIEAKNTQRITEILDYTPGLNILDNEPQIRGGSGFTFGVGSKVAVLVDDMPMTSGDAGRPYWDFVPVENVEQIEVIKGASSVLSGTSALSGAIHIRTALPSDKPLTKITVFTGAYSAPKDKSQKWWDDYPYIAGTNFLHLRKIDNLDFVLGGNLYFEHGYMGAPRPGPMVVDSITNFQDSQMQTQRGRVNFTLRQRSKNYQGLNFGVSGNFMFQHSPMVLAWLDDSAGFYRAYPGAVFLQDQFIGNLDPFVNYYSQAGFKHSFKARILHNNTHQSNNQDIKSTFIFGDYNFRRDYQFLRGLEFIGGVSGQYSLCDADMYQGGGNDINRFYNFSGYAQFENNLFKTLTLSAGLRFEYYNMNGTEHDFKPIFRAGLNLKVMRETYVRLSYGQGYRFPTIAERYIRTNVGSFGVFENPDLKSEKSWNAEVGVKQGFKFFNYFGYLDIALFQQEYYNTIEYLFGFWDSTYSTIGGAGFKFLNTGHSRITGVDVSVSGAIQLAEDMTIRTMFGYNYIMPVTLDPEKVYTTDIRDIEYSYMTTSIDTTGYILKYRFLHTFKGDIELNIHSFSAGFSAKYFSKIENLDKAIEDFEQTTKAAGGSIQPIEYMDYFYTHNNGQWVFDLRASYKINDHNEVSLISNNFMNSSYSLRPLKAESMRNIMLQYVLKI